MTLPMRRTAPDLVITRLPTHSSPACAQDERESASTSRVPSSVPSASAQLPRLRAFSFIVASLIDEGRRYCRPAAVAECRDPIGGGEIRATRITIGSRSVAYGGVRLIRAVRNPAET